MTGQDAIKSAGEFNRRVGVTGVVLTKMDGDARGGAALSVVSVVGVPIAFVGSGERLAGSRAVPRRPRGVAHARHGRRAVAHREGRGGRIDARTRRSSSRRSGSTISRSRTSATSCGRFAKMGPLEQILGMIPGHGHPEAAERSSASRSTRSSCGRVEAIINSMTPKERRNHQLINGSRRKRIARGSGTSGRGREPPAEAVRQMRKMLKMMGGMAAAKPAAA